MRLKTLKSPGQIKTTDNRDTCPIFRCVSATLSPQQRWKSIRVYQYPSLFYDIQISVKPRALPLGRRHFRHTYLTPLSPGSDLYAKEKASIAVIMQRREEMAFTTFTNIVSNGLEGGSGRRVSHYEPKTLQISFRTDSKRVLADASVGAYHHRGKPLKTLLEKGHMRFLKSML